MSPTDAKDAPVTPVIPVTPEWAPATRFYRQVHLAALGLLIFALLVYLLREFAGILQQLFVAAFLAYLIVPAHRWLNRQGLPGLLSSVLMVVGIVSAFWLLGAILYDNFEDLNRKLPVYRNNLGRLVHGVAERFPGVDENKVQHFIGAESPPVELTTDAVRSALTAFFGFVGQMILVVIYLAFMLAERAGFTRRIDRAFGPSRSQRIRDVIGRINTSIQSYILVKTFVSALGGIATTLVLLLFGVDYAVTWGVIAFLLNFIPYLGCWVAVSLPVALSLVQLESWPLTLTILALLLVIQNGIGTIVEPLLAGKRLNLSPLVIIVSLAFWGSLWGITGMILAVPLVVVLTAILENIDETRPIAVLMSNV